MLRTCAIILALFNALAAQDAKPTGAAPVPQPKATYVGSEVCLTCHEDIATAFAQNPHHAVETDKKRGWVGKACESCHGPGSNHAGSASAEDIRNPAKLAPAETTRVCLTCHLGYPAHTGPIQSSHAKNQVACTSCHKIHANGPFGLVARKPNDVNELCATCHVSVMAQFQKPYTHRIVQGAMTCVDCHNPHGSFRNNLLHSVAANEPGCFKCHADKRGPFAFDHAPVRFEGCATCHEPHGSSNPRMLTHQEVRFVCLNCHASLPASQATLKSNGVIGVVPPAFHDLRSPRYQNCAICHQKIHGSYVDRNLLR
jgi:DmsE family decaheme c-type cytochrome